MAVDRPQFLVGCWLETSFPNHVGLSIRLLTRLASPRVSDLRDRKRETDDKQMQHAHDGSTASQNLISEVTFLHFCCSLLLTQNTLAHGSRGLHEATNIRRWGLLGAILEADYHRRQLANLPNFDPFFFLPCSVACGILAPRALSSESAET